MADRADLNGILDNIKSTFDAANTTTASPIDLSSDLTKRVQKVLRIHPQKIPIQASFFPYVTCYITKKAPATKTIAKDQLSAKKTAVIEIDIVGAVWNDSFSDVTRDEGDKDIHYLMENIEYVLRTDPTLGNKVLWQLSDDVNYYDHRLDEQVHLRAGILSVKGTIYY
jgi:hypothetical protein